MSSTPFVGARTSVLPRLAAAGAVLGILPLLHTWVGLPAAYSTVLWVAVIGVVMVVAGSAASRARV